MQTADIPALTDLWTAGYQQGHAGLVPDDLMALRTHKSFHDRLVRFQGPSVVAHADDVPQGFALLRDNEVYQFYVAKSVQGTGLAMALMDQATQTLAASGHETATLDVTIGNDRACRFYEKCGFTNTGIFPVTLDTSTSPYELNCHVFEKSLI